MILFFKSAQSYYAVETFRNITDQDLEKLKWMFGGAEFLSVNMLKGHFTGPRREMITPWSTNAVEICQNMGISGVLRIEEFLPENNVPVDFDPMLQHKYTDLSQD